jgi:hypothetical protein
MPEGAEGPKPEPKPVSRTEGETKPKATKEFSALTTPEKVKAILVGVREPVSQEMVYSFAGIEPNTLTDKEKEAVKMVFDDPRVQHSTNEKSHSRQYCIDPKKQEEVFQELGIESYTVGLQISDSLLKSLYGEERQDNHI